MITAPVFDETWFYAPDAAAIWEAGKPGESSEIGVASESAVELVLDEEEARHAVKALRLRPGTEIRITDGAGSLYEATLIATAPSCRVRLWRRLRRDARPARHFALGWLKGRDLEDPVEALAALHCAGITVVSTDHSSEFAGQSGDKLLERLRTKARSSLKQAKKTWLTDIRGPMTFEAWLTALTGKTLVYAHPGASRLPASAREMHVLIGPEGGFSPRELERLAARPETYRLDLGPTRLRAVHAPLVAAGALQAFTALADEKA